MKLSPLFLFLLLGHASVASAAPPVRSTASASTNAPALSRKVATDEIAESADIVVFWAPFGGGHKSASKAIIADIQSRNPAMKVIMKDVTEFLPEEKRKVAFEMYEKFFSKHPELYNTVFGMHVFLGSVVQPDRLSPFFGYKADELAEWLAKVKPSTIISTFDAASDVLVRLRRDKVLNPEIPMAWMQTDFVKVRRMANISRWLDMTFVPHVDIATAWVEEFEVPREKVMTTGIAVDPSLSVPLSARERKRFLSSKGLKTDRRTIILVSGVNGVGDFPTIIRSIAKASKVPVQIVAICGKNQEQLAAIQNLKLPKHATLKAEGFSTDIPMYFKSADGIVTKAGGLTSSEVFTIGKPVVFLDNNGGQERYNIGFFEERRVANGERDQGKVGESITDLLEDDKEALAMAQRQREFVAKKDKGTAGQWAVESAEAFKRKHPNGVPTLLPVTPPHILKCLQWFTAALE